MIGTAKTRYRSIRNGWGVVLGLGWITYWWLNLAARHKAAIAAFDHCSGFLHSISCSMSKGAADGSYAGGVTLAVITAPLALIASHYFARWRMEEEEKTAVLEGAKREAERVATQRQESDARLAVVEQDAQRARQTVERSDFIHKLGAVSDFLDLLAGEIDPIRIANIRLGAAQALRDLIAKHTIDQLAALIRADHAVQVSVTTILPRLSAASFDEAAEVHVLRAALGGAAVRLSGG